VLAEDAGEDLSPMLGHPDRRLDDITPEVADGGNGGVGDAGEQGRGGPGAQGGEECASGRRFGHFHADLLN
jgi:hypothetical protein